MATIHRVAISYIFLCCNIVERTYSDVYKRQIPKFMKSNACYNLNSGWTNAAWQCTYGYVYTEVQKAEKNFYGNDLSLIHI